METITAMSSRSLQYYVISRRWVADLEFFRLETQFLQRLLDDHFMQLCHEDHLEKLHEVSKKLVVLEQDEQQVDKLIARQLKNIELMAEDVMPEDADALAGTQVQLEYLVTNLTREYRGVKKELFKLVTQAIHKHRIL